jgi:hypothetical protein
MNQLHLLKGENSTQIGNLKGVTTWCEMCKEQTDHNGTWHLEREMDH